MSILSGREILRQVELGHIGIDPFRREHVNPASVDLTLGTKVSVYLDGWTCEDTARLLSIEKPRVQDPHIHDVKEEEAVFDFDFEEWLVLLPGHLYLMHTAESVWTEKFVPILDNKSSIARIGVQVHLCAGFGDPGFRGEYTLEVVTFRAVRLYAGMRICQMRFHEMVGEAENYQKRGHYVGEQRGPVASMVHKQFEGK